MKGMCSHGHPPSLCPECRRESKRRYYLANSENIKARARAWKEVNPEKRRETNRRYFIDNQEKIYKNFRTWKKANREKLRERQRRASLKWEHGISLVEYEEMSELQGGKCAICHRGHGGSCRGRRLYVDHDHKTGKIRGLLCSYCNSALGMAFDDPTILRKAAEYLENHKS